jgi:ribosomal protein L21E
LVPAWVYIAYDEGDHVEISIPDPSDLDHRFHGYKGEIVDILEDDLSGITGEPCMNTNES